MRPLLLHASSKILADNPRRVLHFVFAPAIPPEGLRWPSAARSLTPRFLGVAERSATCGAPATVAGAAKNWALDHTKSSPCTGDSRLAISLPAGSSG